MFLSFHIHRYLKQNARVSSKVSNITDTSRQHLTNWLKADYNLYKHFYNKLQHQIDQYGRDQMAKDVKTLNILNDKLKKDCVLEVADNSKLKGEFKNYINRAYKSL